MLRACALLLALPATLLLAAPAGAQSSKLRMGIHDCYGYDYSTQSLSYKSSIKLISKGRYEHTFGRKGKQMVKKTRGTYRVRGTRMTFSKGAMHRISARIVKSDFKNRPPKFNLLAKNGKAAGITCTWTESANRR
jgi:hypothetical protein